MKGKVVLISGGAAGIGRATALQLVDGGANVVICDVNEELGSATAAATGAAF